MDISNDFEPVRAEDAHADKQALTEETSSPVDSQASTLPVVKSFTQDSYKPLRPSIYGSKRGIRLENGLWLGAGISRQYLIDGIPIAGVINEHGIPRPSLRGPGIWPCEETIEEITRMIECDDLSALREERSLLHLGGPRFNRLRSEYVWIALRQHEDGTFVLSKAARDRLVPNWRELLSPENNAPMPTTFDMRYYRPGVAYWRDEESSVGTIIKYLRTLSSDVACLSHQVERIKLDLVKPLDMASDSATPGRQGKSGMRQGTLSWRVC
ncbi:hypothetical protein PDE_06344 [Penicillium oxalicum 114-2]|uniref:Uncharacterized protein n=1 Tax=Penicillium oxalicum (strain 114-2 / CGMCC 5302) TaxID=933388 RepID=S7ZM46_PENO1|nr:hypothetical protein PDE_06344 [Penicillium oxalicum 114-2]